jgi:hypothetical protein
MTARGAAFLPPERAIPLPVLAKRGNPRVAAWNSAGVTPFSVQRIGPRWIGPMDI